MEETETMQAFDSYEKHGEIQQNNSINSKNSTESVKRSHKTAEKLLTFTAYIWVAGVVVLWGWAAVAYFRLKRRLRFAMKVTKPVSSVSEITYETDMISSPCVVGILHPRIYLIPHLSRQQREHIVIHEQMHIRYLDYLWKFLSYLVVSVHWFNPFLWAMYGIFQGDLEKCCDERVLARIGADKKEDYSESLLALARGKKSRLPSPIAFGAEESKSRIKRILCYRKPVTVVSVLAVVLAVVIGSVFLTAPSANPKAGTLTEGTMIREGISEVYDEISDNNVSYQVRKDGIYCVKNGEEQQIYKGFAGVNTQMLLFEGCLYFLTDKTYTEGALDWVDNTIRWINLSTMETGDLVLDIPEDMPMISEFRMVDDGIIIANFVNVNNQYTTMQCNEGESLFVEEAQRQTAVYTAMLYHKGEEVLNGKAIDQLSDTEAQRFGMATTQALLQAPILANVSHRVQGQNMAYIDLDGDQKAEKIVLKPSPMQKAADIIPGEPLRNYRLQIDNAYVDIFGYNTANTIWALHLDNTFLLATYEDGPSADPYTRFFRYEDGQIIEVGAMDIDIHHCEVNSNATITAPFFKEIVQSDWITIYLELDENGFLREVPQETYDFQKRNFVDLYRELPLHKKIEGEDIFVIPPQKVRFLKTSSDWSWVLLETENGQQGLVHIVDYEVEELKENVMDVFAGVYLAG